MPKRILRDGILTSERVNGLSWPAEVFYRRLHSVVDDFGRFTAHPALLRAACYALRLSDVSDQDVGKWLSDCETKGLVRVYEVDGKRFLEIDRFDQRLRAAVGKYPAPPDAEERGMSPHVAARDGDGCRSRGGDGRSRLPTPCPTSFDVTPEMTQWAVAQGLPAKRVMVETEKMLDHFRANGRRRQDWVATWRNWIRKSVEFSKP